MIFFFMFNSIKTGKSPNIISSSAQAFKMIKYWAKFLTKYLQLNSMFQSPDSNHMTHGAPQIACYDIIQSYYASNLLL